MRQMIVMNPRDGHTTVAYRTEADIEAEVEVGKPAPEDAELVDERKARELFEAGQQYGAWFNTSGGVDTSVEVKTFDPEATEMLLVMPVAGG